jgi:class 3 adenylate cyclase
MYTSTTELKSIPRPHVNLVGTVESGGAVLRTDMQKRSLLTLLFTDIVESTKMIERLGDEAWYHLLMKHNAVVRARLAAFGGREVKCAGDGFFAVFNAAVSAIHCAAGIRSSLQALGMRIRCGLHTSECLVEGSQVNGLAVHIAARIASAARPSEILVSRAVKDLAAGADIVFADGHMQLLRGLSDEHELFTVKA